MNATDTQTLLAPAPVAPHRAQPPIPAQPALGPAQPPAAPEPAPPPARPGVTFLKVAGAILWAMVDECDYERASKIKWSTDKRRYIIGYNQVRDGGDGRKYPLHVFILGRRKGYVIDHIDGDIRNCTRANLRHVRTRVNAFNRPGTTSSRSGLRGVRVHSADKWKVSFTASYRRLSFGSYVNLAEAKLVANAAIGLIYGRHTRLLDNRPFDDEQMERIVADSAGISQKAMRRLLSRTWDQGDALSAKLRRRLKKVYG